MVQFRGSDWRRAGSGFEEKIIWERLKYEQLANEEVECPKGVLQSPQSRLHQWLHLLLSDQANPQERFCMLSTFPW